MTQTPSSMQQTLSQKKRLRLNWYWFTPVIAIALFMFVMVSVLLWMAARDDTQRYNALVRDINGVQQTIRLRLLASKDSLTALIRHDADIHNNEQIKDTVLHILSSNPEIKSISWVDERQIFHWRHTSIHSTNAEQLTERTLDSSSLNTFQDAQYTGQSLYSSPYFSADGETNFDLHIPIIREGEFKGTLVAQYSLNKLMDYTLPEDISKRYVTAVVDENGKSIFLNRKPSVKRAPSSVEVSLDPPGNGIKLRADAYRTRPENTQLMFIWVIVALSAVILWSLIALWRHTRVRSQAEEALIKETNFRRAMENSLLTGMRVLDKEGRITYVNPAFCRIVGWDESDLLGKKPPYPYWSDEQSPELAYLNGAPLNNKTSARGIELNAIRRDGSTFTARLYVSPFIDQSGEQTGWMTSLTDITEATHTKQALSIAHERFTTVLEGLEDAISVTAENSEGNIELLFTNQTYRRIFSGNPNGHIELSGSRRTRHNDEPVEVYSGSVQLWFEVRHRTLQWVDGRRVRMQVARDITDTRSAEEASQAHQDKVELTSRLITMGEMASSLAHELNQPLTAIANYSMGAVALMKSGANYEQILPALEKATAQAQRAGMIIRRIREFVKRSEPNRQHTSLMDIIDNVSAFAEIEARKYGVNIIKNLQENYPDIYVDPILIEQVLLNIMKNGIESMENSATKVLRLNIHAYPDHVEFEILDHGHGISDENLERLFEPFFSTKQEGMGMGLNICRSIIEFHHGRLWANHNPAGGTIFHFTIPILNLNTRPTGNSEDTK